MNTRDGFNALRLGGVERRLQLRELGFHLLRRARRAFNNRLRLLEFSVELFRACFGLFQFFLGLAKRFRAHVVVVALRRLGRRRCLLFAASRLFELLLERLNALTQLSVLRRQLAHGLALSLVIIAALTRFLRLGAVLHRRRRRRRALLLQRRRRLVHGHARRPRQRSVRIQLKPILQMKRHRHRVPILELVILILIDPFAVQHHPISRQVDDFNLKLGRRRLRVLHLARNHRVLRAHCDFKPRRARASVSPRAIRFHPSIDHRPPARASLRDVPPPRV